MSILESIGAGIVSIALFVGGLFGYSPEKVYAPSEPAQTNEELGRAVNPVATNNYTIAGSGISSSATTITLTSFTAPVSGVPYTMANFGEGVNAKGYLTIEPGSRTRQEIVSFTGITQNSDGSAILTGVSRGLLPFSPFTASTTYAVAHNGGSQVVVSNPPQLYDAIYSYIDNATTSGAVDGTTLAKGIYETATGLEAASSTQTGAGNTTATLVLTTLISTSTGGTAYTVPMTKQSGKLDSSFFGEENYIDIVASSTFTGVTLPQAGYINASGSINISSAVSSTTNKYSGFVLTNSATGATATVQINGVVSGFSGLIAGRNYYLSDTSGAISTTGGTAKTLVGQAVSSTEILIRKSPRTCTGHYTNTSLNTITYTIDYCGFVPSTIRINAFSADNEHFSTLSSVYTNGELRSLSAYYNEATNGDRNLNNLLHDAQTDTFLLSIGAITPSSFEITWTESGVFSIPFIFSFEAIE